MSGTVAVATIMTNGQLNSAEESAQHVTAIERAASVEVVDNLDGWGVSLRGYVIGDAEWAAVIVIAADNAASTGSRFVNIHTFGSMSAAVLTFRAVTEAISVVTYREP